MADAKSMNAAEEVLKDLCDRHRVGHALEQIKYGDAETWNELRMTLADIIEREMS